jgi:hypothetical protein
MRPGATGIDRADRVVRVTHDHEEENPWKVSPAARR